MEPLRVRYPYDFLLRILVGNTLFAGYGFRLLNDNHGHRAGDEARAAERRRQPGERLGPLQSTPVVEYRFAYTNSGSDPTPDQRT